MVLTLIHGGTLIMWNMELARHPIFPKEKKTVMAPKNILDGTCDWNWWLEIIFESSIFFPLLIVCNNLAGFKQVSVENQDLCWLIAWSVDLSGKSTIILKMSTCKSNLVESLQFLCVCILRIFVCVFWGFMKVLSFNIFNENSCDRNIIEYLKSIYEKIYIKALLFK